MKTKSNINLRILREGKDAVCDSIERGTMTFGSLFKKYPFPTITEEKMKRAEHYKTTAFPVLFVNEHIFIGTPEIDRFITKNKSIEELISGPSLIVQMRYRVPICRMISSLPFSELSERTSLTAELGVPESYWGDFD